MHPHLRHTLSRCTGRGRVVRSVPREYLIATMKTYLHILLLCTATLTGFTACKDKPTSTKEKIKDGLDVRPHEKIKDAAEDIKDAVKN